MENFLSKALSIFLYLASAMIFLVGISLLYAAYRDSDFKLSLFGLMAIIGAKMAFDTARKK